MKLLLTIFMFSFVLTSSLIASGESGREQNKKIKQTPKI